MTQLNDPAFTIRIAPARKFVDIIMFGHWGAATMQHFDSELRRLLPALPAGGCRIGDQNTLFDTTDYAVQSQDEMEQFGGMAADKSIGSRRIAVLVSKSLAKLQVRRIAPDYGVLTERDEATRRPFEPDG